MREESDGTFNKVMESGKVLALGQNGSVCVELEWLSKMQVDVAVRNEGLKIGSFLLTMEVHS